MYNLTENQKELARWIVAKLTAREIGETFIARFHAHKKIDIQFHGKYARLTGSQGRLDFDALTPGSFEALVAADLLHKKVIIDLNRFQVEEVAFTITGRIYEAVSSNFHDAATRTASSAIVQPHPPEIAVSLDRLRAKYADPSKLGFLIMPFTATKPFEQIAQVVKATAEKYGVTVIRADENEFHADLLSNVRTHLHGCGFGIAVYERIESDNPNPNVGFEVGYLMAMNKPVLLLKDRTVKTLQADLAGRLYKPFDPHSPDATTPNQLTKWLEDNGIIVPEKRSLVASGY